MRERGDMFTKVFVKIFDSSIAADLGLRHFFMDILVLADRDGLVDMTPMANDRAHIEVLRAFSDDPNVDLILTQMREELNGLGVSAWTLQQFHAAEILDDDLAGNPTYSDAELIGIARNLGNHTRVRGLKGSFIFNS